MFETKGVQESVKTLLQISGANKGINKLEQDFRIWIGSTLAALLAAVLSVIIATQIEGNDLETRLIKVGILFICLINAFLAFFLYKESQRRYRYLNEVKKVLEKSKGLKNAFMGLFSRN